MGVVWSLSIDGPGYPHNGGEISEMAKLHLHCVSDSTGETIHQVARACMVQFEGVEPVEHLWPMARTPRAMDQVLEDISDHRGLVMFTLVNQDLRDQLMEGCRRLKVPCISVLDPVIAAVGSYLGVQPSQQPGRQHAMDAEYFRRIEAMDWSLAHDDGQQTEDIGSGDVILVGVSRTSKTPTSLYLANRGIKTANVPYVRGLPLPAALDSELNCLVVGLTKDAKRLVEIRRSRLLSLKQDAETAYVDLDEVRAEINDARRYFKQRGWPIIDVSGRSIEETAAAIMQLLRVHQGGQGSEAPPAIGHG